MNGDVPIRTSQELGSKLADAELTPLGLHGTYCLNNDSLADCFVQHASKAIRVDAASFEELWAYGDSVAPTPNPMNKNYMIKRKQATFGSEYRFGQQLSHAVMGEESAWPQLVQLALQDARSRSSEPQSLRVCHVNWYPDGAAGLAPHADNEDLFQPGMPIYSYTLLSDPSLPRAFQIYEGEEKTAKFSFRLGHGDLLVMAGNMQNHYKHGLKATAAKAYANLRRINVTVRHLK